MDWHLLPLWIAAMEEYLRKPKDAGAANAQQRESYLQQLRAVRPGPDCNGHPVCFTTYPPRYGVIGCTCGQCPK